jgi:hypothetical protein
MKKGGGAPGFRPAFRIVTALCCPRCHAACWRTASAVRCQSREGNRLLWRSKIAREQPRSRDVPPVEKSSQRGSASTSGPSWRRQALGCAGHLPAGRPAPANRLHRLGGSGTRCGSGDCQCQWHCGAAVNLARQGGDAGLLCEPQRYMAKPVTVPALACEVPLLELRAHPTRHRQPDHSRLNPGVQRVRGRWQASVRQELA